jgi:hypothetical protein
MSLDGLRAWIGEVERQLGMRTRVFLALVAIAIGGAGTAIYLAAEAQNDQVSKGDLQAVESALQSRIETLEANAATGTSEAGGNAVLEAQVRQLQAKVEALESTDQGNSQNSKDQGSKSGGEQAPQGSEDESNPKR